ncbi:MAG: SDR family oxidoreductase [Polyangiaceae bacterium]
MSKKLRVFVTGATGWIGTALVRELRAAGHQVLGMARNDAGVDRLKAQGVEVYRADLREPERLVEAVRSTDATIHLAFHMDFADWEGINRIDREAIACMLGALEGTGKTFIGTSGTLLLASPGTIALETDAAMATGPIVLRARAERLVLDAVKRGVHGGVVRLAPTVHGAGDKGFIAMLIEIARSRRVAGYLGDGATHWPAVHRDDAARLYRLALESMSCGNCLHGVAEQGISQRAIAEVIGEQLGVPVESIPADQAAEHFGFMAMVVGLDNRVSSRSTRELCAWTPEGPGLLDDMRAHYF